jgi:hypothetical protein
MKGSSAMHQTFAGLNLGSFVLPLGLLLPLLFLELILIVFASIDLLRRDSRRIRGNKLMWIPIILLISTLGPIIYFIVGRKES